MVEYTSNLDLVFGSLADPTRRDILRRLTQSSLSVSEIAMPYDLTLAAVSKHLKILEKAKLIMKRRKGKQQIVQLIPQTFSDADDYINFYKELWTRRYNSLEDYLNQGN